MGKGLDPLVGGADKADEERRASGRGGGLRRNNRKIAAATDDGQRPPLRRARLRRRDFRPARHTVSSFPGRGTQMARSPPSRRKSKIWAASGRPANSGARLSTRSFSVPSAPNSSR